MCYILIAKQLKQPSPHVESQIRGILKEQANHNNDGFFIKNGADKMRTLDDKKAMPELREVALDNLMVHFRWASVGKVKEENVHGWELGEWQFFHNGGVSDYIKNTTGMRDQEEADSYLFFQDLYLFLQEINGRKDKQVERVIRDLVTDTNFHGRAALYNTQTDKMYLFGDFHIYCFGDSHIVISSATLTLNKSAEKKSHGFEFSYTNEAVVGEMTTSGIGVIHNFSRAGFVYRYLGVLKNPPPAVPTPPHSQYTQPQKPENSYKWWQNGEDWDYRNGQYYRKPLETLPAGNSEQEEMAENIELARSELREINEGSYDDDIEIDPDIISDSNGVINQFTPEEIDNAIVNMLQDEFGFIGTDVKTGAELFLDQAGIHDSQRDCCRLGECRDVDDFTNIEFVNLENLKLPEVEGITRIDTILGKRKLHAKV